MAERSILIRVSVTDADKAVAELRKIGQQGETAISRIERVSAPASRGLAVLDRSSRSTQIAIQGLTTAFDTAGVSLPAFGGQMAGVSTGLAGLGVAAAGAGVAIAAIGATLVAAAVASDQNEQSQRRLDAVIKATGQSAGVTSAQIQQFAEDMAQSTMAASDDVERAANVLLSFRSVAGDTFFETMRLAQDLSAVFGQDLQASVTQLGKAMEDPISGLTALGRVGVQFTETQKDLIRTFEEAGQRAEAQGVILDVLRQKVGGAGAAEGGGLSGSVHHLKEQWGEFLEELGATTGVTTLASAALTELTSLTRSARELMAGGPGTFTAGQEAARATDPEAAARAEIAASQAKHDRVLKIEHDLDASLMDLRENRVAKIKSESETAIRSLEALRTPDSSRDVDEAIAKRRELTRRQVAEATEGERKAAEASAKQQEREAAAAEEKAKRATEANDKIVEGLQFEREELTKSDKQQEIDAALRRLSAEATDAQREAVVANAGALHDERAAMEARKKTEEDATRDREQTMREGARLKEDMMSPQEVYNQSLGRTNELLQQGAIDEQTASRARQVALQDYVQSDEALSRMVDTGVKVSDTLVGAFDELVFKGGDFKDVLGQLEQSLLDIGTQALVLDPLKQWMTGQIVQGAGQAGSGGGGIWGLVGQLFGAGVGAASGAGGAPAGTAAFTAPTGTGGFEALTLHGGGWAGDASLPTRQLPAALFVAAPRFHDGGMLASDEVPVVLQRGERVLSRAEVANLGQAFKAGGGVFGGPLARLWGGEGGAAGGGAFSLVSGGGAFGGGAVGSMGGGGGVFGGGAFGAIGGGKGGSIMSGGAGGTVMALFRHGGGLVGDPSSSGRWLPAGLFADAPRLHDGIGSMGMMLRSDEFPAVLQGGEQVLSRAEVAAGRTSPGRGGPVNVNVEIKTPNPSAFRQSQAQISSDLRTGLMRSERFA